MRRWIVFGFGALILGAAAWYFGKPMKVQIPSPTQAAVEVAQAEPVKEPAPKVIEVIDLARAYEPVPEPEETVGGVDPATFIPAPEAPARIPYARDESHLFRDALDAIRRTPLGAALFRRTELESERIEVTPREVQPARGDQDPNFWELGSTQVQDFRLFEEYLTPVRINVMPREVSWPLRSGPVWFLPVFHGDRGFILMPELRRPEVVIRSGFGHCFTTSDLWLSATDPVPGRLDAIVLEVK